MVPLVFKAFKEPQAHKVLQVYRVLREPLVLMASLVGQVLKVLKDRLELQVLRVQQD
jgi:hypothetical protein